MKTEKISTGKKQFKEGDWKHYKPISAYTILSFSSVIDITSPLEKKKKSFMLRVLILPYALQIDV